MTDAEIVALIKIDLGIASTTKDALLEHLEKTAKRNIETEGITLALNDIADCDLVRMYTVYLFQKRSADDTSMPRMLRYALNQRLIADKGAVDV